MLRLAALALPLLFFSSAARADDVADFYRGKELRLIVSPRSAAAMTSTPARSRAISARTFQAIPRSCRRTCRQRAAWRRQPSQQRGGKGRHRHRAVSEHRAARAILREQAGAVRRREDRLARHADHREPRSTCSGTAPRSGRSRTRSGRSSWPARPAPPRRPPSMAAYSPDLQFSRPASSPVIPARTRSCWRSRTARSKRWHRRSWSSLKTARPGWHKEGKIRFLFQYGSDPHPDLKDVPLALDLLAKSS